MHIINVFDPFLSHRENKEDIEQPLHFHFYAQAVKLFNYMCANNAI